MTPWHCAHPSYPRQHDASISESRSADGCDNEGQTRALIYLTQPPFPFWIAEPYHVPLCFGQRLFVGLWVGQVYTYPKALIYLTQPSPMSVQEILNVGEPT